MQCPKCGRSVEEGAVICGACDFIIDASFLGDDITNERSDDGAAVSSPGREAYGGDALILGDLSDEYDSFLSEETGGFLTAATQEVQRLVLPAPVYVDKATQALLEPDAVLEALPESERSVLELSPFEQHVLTFIDGARPVARLRKKCGLSKDDLRIALAMLAEKRAIRLAGRARPAGYREERAPVNPALDEPTEVDDGLPSALGGDRPASVSGIAPGDVPALIAELVADTDDGPAPWNDGGEAPRPAEPSSAVVGGPGVPGVPGAPRTPASVRGAPLVEPASTAVEPPPEMSLDDEAALDEASAASVRVSEADRQKARQVYELALKDLAENRMTRARMYAKLAASLDPGEASYRELLEDWNRRSAELIQSGAGAPPDVQLFIQAQQKEAEGNYEEAVRLLRESLKLNPEVASVHNRLGVILATRLKDFTGALTHLFKAAELEPGNAAFRNNLGKVIAMAESPSGAMPAAPRPAPSGRSEDKGAKGAWSKLLKKKLF